MTKNVEITKSYTTPKGTLVTINGRLELEKISYADGYNIPIDCCDIYINVNVPGRGDQGESICKMTDAQKAQSPAGYNWIVGKLGLTDAQAEIIRSVRAELEQHPAWQAKQARIAANEASKRADYEHKKATGFCFRCDSYCYGDCTAN